MTVANNHLEGNSGAAVFFEISDDLLLINNRIFASGSGQPVKLAGSSGLKVVNNTIVGGKDPIGIYTDSRSKPGCADPSQPLCAGSYSSERDSKRPIPDTLDWMPRLDYMINNIVASPHSSGLCGGTAALCILSHNADAYQPLEEIIHQADPTRGIPQTFMDTNLYLNGSTTIIRTVEGNHSSASSWSSAAAGSPIYIGGIDANSASGATCVNSDGSLTGSVSHSSATPVPNDAKMNLYVPAGTRHYGALRK